MRDGSDRSFRAHLKRGIEIAVGLAALVGTVVIVGARSFWDRLRALDPAWLAVGLALTVLQFILLGARWWFVARKLDVPLRYGRALREYYLSTLLNYILPLGVFGDAFRAVRHLNHVPPKEQGQPAARVVLAIVLERASGQLALWLVALAVAPDLWRALSPTMSSHSTAAKAIAALVVVAVALTGWALGRRWLTWLRDAARAGGQVLFRPANLVVHLPVSLVLVATHVALFVVAARSIGLELAMGPAIRIVPPVLVASTLPTLLGGFGAREATAAGLYHLTGLSAVDGATISFVYGSVGILASVPGVLALPWRARR
jgi:uncharacterized membrane protein YbhN (UPF0104 family)